METPRDCFTCRSLATHEDCDKDGGCLTLPEDYAKYRATGIMPPSRYRHWVESNPLEQLTRLHELQKSGARNIVLGPGEAEVNARWTPHEASENLHRVACECGYMVSKLGRKFSGLWELVVFKDFGPFLIQWDEAGLLCIKQGKETPLSVFWKREGVL